MTQYKNDDNGKKKHGKKSSPIDPKAFLLQVLFATISCLIRFCFAGNSSSTYYIYSKKISLILLALFMFGGANLRRNKKLVDTLLIKIVPPPLPPYFCVYASGVCEGICGLFILYNLIYPSDILFGIKDIGGTSVVLLLWAVFPANIYHAMSKKAQIETKINSPTPLYIRVIIQFIFLGWAGWHADINWLTQYYIYS
jgi:uncharacterized membrane protein|eukprot:g6573.t1